MFDGSCINYPLEVLVIRFIDQEDLIQQRVVAVNIPEEPLTGQTAQQLLQKHLDEADLRREDLLCSMSDRGSVNKPALELLRGDLRIVGRSRSLCCIFVMCELLLDV